MAKARLDKVLGHMALGTRKEVRDIIKDGRVRVDGQVVENHGIQVDPDTQVILVDGKALNFQQHFYVLMHKPGGVITATEDPRKQTVMDVLPPHLLRPDLFPVGRLDKDTEGLLLFTTDGELCHRLLSPKWHVDKVYLARVEGTLNEADVAAFATGITLEDGYECMPGRLAIAGADVGELTIQEGKYHQVKRMFGARGKPVVYLKRLRMGPLELGDLALGGARPLTEAEIGLLYESAGLARP